MLYLVQSDGCTTKFPFASVHDRVVFVTIAVVGAAPVKIPAFCAGDRYLPQFAFNDVFPLPNRSYAAPTLGVRFLKSTPSVRGIIVATGMNRVPPMREGG